MTDWPQMMRKQTAMAYLDLSEPEFVREIAAGRIPEVQAVTGQSVEIVLHYAANVDQGRLSEEAIIKLQSRK